MFRDVMRHLDPRAPPRHLGSSAWAQQLVSGLRPSARSSALSTPQEDRAAGRGGPLQEAKVGVRVGPEPSPRRRSKLRRLTQYKNGHDTYSEAVRGGFAVYYSFT